MSTLTANKSCGSSKLNGELLHFIVGENEYRFQWCTGRGRCVCRRVWLRYEVRLKRNFNYSFGQAPSLCVHSVYTAIGGNLRYGGGLVILHKWPDKWCLITMWLKIRGCIRKDGQDLEIERRSFAFIKYRSFRKRRVTQLITLSKLRNCWRTKVNAEVEQS